MSRSLFDLVVPADRASKQFLDLRGSRGFTAGRRLMDEVFADFHDVDRSFLREFQTGGFSARVFELALFAYLREQGYEVDRASAGPDFIIREPVPFVIEATTANPPQAKTWPASSIRTKASLTWLQRSPVGGAGVRLPGRQGPPPEAHQT